MVFSLLRECALAFEWLAAVIYVVLQGVPMLGGPYIVYRLGWDAATDVVSFRNAFVLCGCAAAGAAGYVAGMIMLLCVFDQSYYNRWGAKKR